MTLLQQSEHRKNMHTIKNLKHYALKIASFVISILFIGTSHLAYAETPPEITALQVMDEKYLERHRDAIEDITKMEFGSRLRGDKSDFRHLSRIIENDYIRPAETEKQYSLGVVLGDIFVTELGLEWKSYKDDDGTSLATCLPRTTHCLFPVTMLAKRMKLGVKPDIEQMYNHGKTILDPYLPKLPYSVKK